MSYRQSVHWIKPLVFLTISALILCISQKPGAGADNVRVAYSSPTATQGILWVADVGGLFKKNGLDVQVIYTRLAIESLVAGEIDFGQMTGFGQAPLRGFPARERRGFLVPMRDGGLVTPLQKFGHRGPMRVRDEVGVHRRFVLPRGQCPEGQAICCS